MRERSYKFLSHSECNWDRQKKTFSHRKAFVQRVFLRTYLNVITSRLRHGQLMGQVWLLCFWGRLYPEKLPLLRDHLHLGYYLHLRDNPKIRYLPCIQHIQQIFRIFLVFRIFSDFQNISDFQFFRSRSEVFSFDLFLFPFNFTLGPGILWLRLVVCKPGFTCFLRIKEVFYNFQNTDFA